jgi:hypothetical protein
MFDEISAQTHHRLGLESSLFGSGAHSDDEYPARYNTRELKFSSKGLLRDRGVSVSTHSTNAKLPCRAFSSLL